MPYSTTTEQSESKNGIRDTHKTLFTCKMEFQRNRCQATKSNGCLCMAYLGTNQSRCKTHQNVLDRKGPKAFLLDEVAYRFKRMTISWRSIVTDDTQYLTTLFRRMLAWKLISVTTFENMTDQECVRLLTQRGAWYILGHPEPITEAGIVIDVPQAPPVLPGTELGKFAADKQNVHRKATVDQTTEIVKRVLKIPVPPEYRWNTETLSKTPGEIITYCKLTPLAGATMTEKYSRDDDVYDLGKGIYGKVLDCVWQYISKSDDKTNMCAILKQELQDNIGMCAQGNLSRLCNALAGYMEGIEDTESPAEKLGRLIPPLMDITDTNERIQKVKNLLEDVGLPKTEWENWLSACM